ncbi:MAG: FtsQ-type POTRA domain-containing protein [Coriobacteriales bacterium]|nr:FtsQ-type POTRA domain-containing protein [Coriobacteriales bacterium]
MKKKSKLKGVKPQRKSVKAKAAKSYTAKASDSNYSVFDDSRSQYSNNPPRGFTPQVLGQQDFREQDFTQQNFDKQNFTQQNFRYKDDDRPIYGNQNFNSHFSDQQNSNDFNRSNFDYDNYRDTYNDSAPNNVFNTVLSGSSNEYNERVHKTTVKSARREQRFKKAKNKLRNKLLIIALIVLCVLALIFGGVFVYRSPLFAVENVEVTGVSHLTNEEITQLAAVPNDSTLLRIDADGICKRLQTHAWIQSATIHRNFPNTITIEIVERSPAATVKVNANSTWVISNDGIWLSAATNDDIESLRKIIDVDATIATPSSGVSCKDEGVLNAIDIFAGLSTDFVSQIDSISAPSASKTQLNLKNGVVVAFGDATEIELKESVIKELMAQNEGKISYINVRIPSRPIFRSK